MPEAPGLALDEELTSHRPIGFGAWLGIAVTYQHHHRVLTERLAPLGVSVAQLDVLANLYVTGGCRQKELAARMLVTKANVTGLINRLVERGWVERWEDSNDRRANQVKLSRSGRRVAQRALAVRQQLIEDAMSALSPEEREQLEVLTKRLAQRLRGL